MVKQSAQDDMVESPTACDPEGLPDRLLKAFQYWRALKGERELPLRAAFDPLDVPALLPHLLVVEVLRGSQDPDLPAPQLPNSQLPHSQLPHPEPSSNAEVTDFRFRLVGTYIDDRVKDSYTGRRLSEIEGKGAGSDVWAAYCEVEATGKPKVLSLNYIGPMDGIQKSWEIFLPFSATGERVDFILVLIEFE